MISLRLTSGADNSLIVGECREFTPWGGDFSPSSHGGDDDSGPYSAEDPETTSTRFTPVADQAPRSPRS